VNPYSASSAETIEEVFPQGDMVKLFRSYRSSIEITSFAQRIKSSPGLIPMERHGPEPAVTGFVNQSEEIKAIRQAIDAFKTSPHKSLAVICRTQREANHLFREIKQPGFHLLTPDSTAFHQGVVVTTAHVAKGLEFDAVIVPFVSEEEYHSDVDRGMLYIACTRAMHSLTLTYSGQRSSLLQLSGI
jgi:DNA helicase-2/ATP-dependent DNA helicase PcrA